MKPVVIIIGIIVALLLVLFFWLKHFFNKQIILPLNDLQQFMAKNSDVVQPAARWQEAYIPDAADVLQRDALRLAAVQQKLRIRHERRAKPRR